jgi:hypothetical protein
MTFHPQGRQGQIDSCLHDKQPLAAFQHLAANDPAEDVCADASAAAEKYANKLRCFMS